MNKILIKILIIYLFTFYILFLFKYNKYEYFDNLNTNTTKNNTTNVTNTTNTLDITNTKKNNTTNTRNNNISDKTKLKILELQKENNMYNNDKYQMYGPTNYLDPKDMTDTERISYMNLYPDNMTLQDYVNWLLLYKNKQEYLSVEHIKNLKKILRGEQLIYQAGVLPPPTKISPPLSSSDYFDNLYTNKNIISRPQIGNSIHNEMMMTYNSDDYGDFKDNYDVYGTSGRSDLNPDLPDKKNLNNFISFDNEKKFDKKFIKIKECN